MLRGLKKIRKNFNEVQRSRSNGSTDDDRGVGGGGSSLDTPRRETIASGRNITEASNSTSGDQIGVSSSTTGTMNKTVGSFRPPSKSRSTSRMEKDAKVPYLAAFDKCIEASDAIIASSYACNSNESVFAARKDSGTGLPDCSLLVSPDGDLLLVPTNEDLTNMFRPKQARAEKNHLGHEEDPRSASKPANDILNADVERDDDDEDDVGLNVNVQPASLGSFSELMRQSKDEYESAMFLGNDLQGDKALNRFSAKGWSVPAATLAVQQTGHALAAFGHFCEQIVLARKESAARVSIACDHWRTELDRRRGFDNLNPKDLPISSEQWEILDPRATAFELSPGRVGPLTSHGSTLHAAAMAIEQYHHEASEKESHRWRMATIQRNAVLPAIHMAIDVYHERATKRQQALAETSHRARMVEERIRKLKQVSEAKWDAVYKAEDRVTLRMEELMAERSKERQKARLKHLRDQHQQQTQDGTSPSTATSTIDELQVGCSLSDEVWDMVSSVAESMEHGSFEPIPDTASTISDEASPIALGPPDGNTARDDFLSLPIVSREEIEQELGLPELRAAARQVDEDLQDESGTLLNILSALDTTRRSARIASETCLVSAANSQASCLRSMLELERESLRERLRDLDGLEHVLDKIDVRADLDAYISSDKKELGGCSHLGDDDDGGIASALAVLSSHVEGIFLGEESSVATNRRRLSTENSVESANNETKDEITMSLLNEALEKVFQDHPALSACDNSNPDKADKKYCADFDQTVDFLCHSVSGNAPVAKARRSALCYALNSRRGTYARIATMKQYDAISKIFSSILTAGLDDEEAGVTNAKMCMMLAQTFYFLDDEATLAGEDNESGPLDDELNQSARKVRQMRLYIKNALTNHPIWAKDDFWFVPERPLKLCLLSPEI
jgi:hypothetical protein